MEQVMQSTLGDEVLGFQWCHGCQLVYPLDCLNPTIGGYVLCDRCLESRTRFFTVVPTQNTKGNTMRKVSVIADMVSDEALCSLVQEVCEVVGFEQGEVAGINTRERALDILTNLTHVASANPLLAVTRTEGPLSLDVLFPTDEEELPAVSLL